MGVGGGGVAGGSSLASVLRASGLVAVAAGFRANTSPMIKSKSKPVTLPSCYSCCASIHDKLVSDVFGGGSYIQMSGIGRSWFLT